MVISSRIFKTVYCLFLAALGLCCFVRLPLVAISGGYSCCGAQVSHCSDFSFAVEHRLWACRLQELWHTGLVAPWHVKFSHTGDQNHVPCIGRRIIIHCATREVPSGTSLGCSFLIYKVGIALIFMSCALCGG